jgi:diguanylate cyclase (GGDEF)-like protein/PAS domain S-box-containing protein
LTGERLEIVEQKQAQSLVLLLKLKQEFSIYFGSIWRQLTLNLLSQAEDKCCLIGNSFNELKMLHIFVETNNRSLLFLIYFTKTYLSYLFKDYDQAVAHAYSAEKYVQAIAGMASIAEHNFYYSLALLAKYTEAKPNEQRQYLSKLSANQEKMQKWAHHAPMNFLHKYYLVEAEKARVLGQVVEAMDLYERAIKGARDNGYIQHEALAYELAANFYLARGMQEFAQLYMTKAHYGYVRWGAKAKVKDLEQQYPDFFAKTPSSPTKTTTTILSTDSKTSSELDLNSILKASQTLSSEIVLNTLLEKMMKIVLENAGAQKGYLILNQEAQWLIQASGAVTSDDIEVLQSIPIETVSDRNNISIVPLGIVNYVIRTQESIILNDALHSGNFSRDPYIVKHQTKSVLCMPLLNQSKLAGLLYLENNQSTGAFTPERLEVLKLLTSQIFISIENAQLYTNLQAYSTELLKANRQLQAEIGDRKLAEEALRLSEERFRLAIDNIPDTFVIYDAKRRFQFVNAFAVNRGGFPLEAYIGHTDEEIHPPEVTNAYLPFLQKTVETRTKQTGECNITLPGCSFTIVVSYVPILNEHGEIHQILGITHDITERKRAEEQLLHNAFHDALTGLPNRAWFMERLKDAIERAKQQENYLFAVLFLDLDRFKVINDSLGHLVGDQFLIKIAARLKACLRPIDTAARLGGDEFTILLEGIENLSEAIEVVELIQQELALPFDLDGQEVFTTASIGIALNSILTYDQPENLLRDADTAMYRAKVLGRARYELFNPDMYTNAVGRLQLETDLRRAIERREFRVYYQPIVSLSTGTISGFEALLRWQHPERGLLSPADFIPVAEETGLIVEIGYWVLFEACRQMQVWQMRYPTSFLDKISVNLCVKQFYQADLIEQIAEILHSTGLDACSLMLEITESAIMENGDEANTALSQLREMGIELSIDDFGTGYSSLGRLHTFPINVLKIDRSFVSPVDANNRNLGIIEIIVTLADKLAMDVTAEGVETQEQLALVRKLKCEYGQGYFFSRPLDSSAAEALIMANPRW